MSAGHPQLIRLLSSLCAQISGGLSGVKLHTKMGELASPRLGLIFTANTGANGLASSANRRMSFLRSKLTPTELAEEVAAARRFVPPLKRFIVATTGPADVRIQEAARKLEEHTRQGLFEVEVWSWTEIWAELSRRPSLLQVVGPIYWPRLFFVKTENSSQDQTEKIVQAIQSPFCFPADSSSRSRLRQPMRISVGSTAIKPDFIACLRR